MKNRTHYKEVVNLTIINETELPFIEQIESGDFIYDASSLLEGLGNIDQNYVNEIMHGSYPVTIKFNGETSDLFFYNDEMSFGSYSDYAAGTIPFIAKFTSDFKLNLYTKIQAESATASAFCTIENFKLLDSRYLPYNVPLIGDDGMLPSQIVPKNETKVFVFTYDRNGTKEIKADGGFTYNDIVEAHNQRKIIIARVCRKNVEEDSFNLILDQAFGGFAIFKGYTRMLGFEGIVELVMKSDGSIKINNKDLYLKSSESSKIFRINVDDSGTLTATEVTT